ncbi:MAG: hypothetical protein ACI3W5_17530 [Faecousia sp.]
MTKQWRSIPFRIVAILLAFVLIAPSSAFAATTEQAQPYGSYYLTSYSAYVYVTASGEVQVWFDVMGTNTMDEIGALLIMLYESSDGTNWTVVKKFYHDRTSGMLFENDYYVSSHVSWAGGSTSKQYKAYVCVWAGKDGNGDSRNFWAYEP